MDSNMQTKFDPYGTKKKEPHSEILKGKRVCEGPGDREGTSINLVLFISY